MILQLLTLINRKHQIIKTFRIFLKAEIIILSGIELSILELPFKIPPFQVQLYKGKKYVFIPSLHTIQNDTVLKRKLWEAY